MLEPHARRAGRRTAPPCRRSPRALAALGLAAALLLPTAALAAETAAAREQARLCERLSGEPAVAACRSALALGIGPARRGPVRELLGRQLVALERWDELAELFRDAVRQDPADAVAWQRLGAALLFTLDAPAEALGALQEAVRLAPRDAAARVTLGLALAANGRPPEAAAALEEALRLDASALDGRPAARAVLDAARQGRAWP